MEQSSVEVHYCGIEGYNQTYYNCGIYAEASTARIFNSFFKNCMMGVCGADQGLVYLVGDNHLHDCIMAGLVSYNSSLLIIRQWNENPGYELKHFKTDVRTTASAYREKYCAAKIMRASSLVIYTEEDTHHSGGLLNIIKANPDPMAQYYGVVLDSKALLQGASRISFVDPDVLDGKVTVPAAQQIIAASGEQTLVVD